MTKSSASAPASGVTLVVAVSHLAGREEFPLTSASDRPVVLYIEDSPINAKLMERFFARSFPEFELTIAVDGKSGLNALVEQDPFLVLLDCHLPDASGLEVLKSVRAMGRGVPMVVVTADARSELAESMLDAGADGFLTKPIDFQELVAQVRKHVEAASNAS